MTRALGVLLFLPVPLVLWLLTRTPLGVGPSLLLAVAIVGTHRLYARPFALSHAARRCLWCGGAARDAAVVDLVEPGGPTRWAACAGTHADALRRACSFLSAHRAPLRVGVLGFLAVLLAVEGGVAAGLVAPSRLGTAVAAFRTGIALTVLPVGLLALRRPAEGAREALPFPVHIQALVGTRAVLWLFRIVGLAWLVLGVAQLAGVG
jgi:hypothetical protein